MAENILETYGNRKSQGREILPWAFLHVNCEVCGAHAPHRLHPGEDESVHVQCRTCGHAWMTERYLRSRMYLVAYAAKNPLPTPTWWQRIRDFLFGWGR